MIGFYSRRPQDLNLTAVNETILMDNVEILLKNGFEFSIDPTGGRNVVNV